MTQPTHPKPRHETPSPRVLNLELLALDLGSCTRCVGSLANVETAIDTVRRVLIATGRSVRVEKVVIESEEQARRYRFRSSPTIRIDGRDIVLDALESRCDSCTDLCGCDEGTSCRVWRYQGQEHNEAPVGLVAEALLHAILEDSVAQKEACCGGSEPGSCGCL